MQLGIYASVILALKAARRSGLNIGIIEAIWSIAPFCIAFAEWIIYKVGLKLYQIVGMIAIVAMTILISLSDLFNDEI